MSDEQQDVQPGKPAKGRLNKDGFKPGQRLTQKDLAAYRQKKRGKK